MPLRANITSGFCQLRLEFPRRSYINTSPQDATKEKSSYFNQELLPQTKSLSAARPFIGGTGRGS